MGNDNAHSVPTLIARQFQIAGNLHDMAPLKIGHINETFVSRWENGPRTTRYVHQLVNHNVFTDVPSVMANIERVTHHIRRKLNAGEGIKGERTLTLVPTHEGAFVVQDPEGNWWRTYEFVEGTYNVSQCNGSAEATEAGRAFGRFQRYLFDLPSPALVDPIPGFQDTASRMVALEWAISEDKMGRVRDVTREISFIRDRTQEASMLVTLLSEGRVPMRITHGDTKLNNVLFSNESKRGVCVVDLDTCMNGSILYDFGDLVRNTTQTAAEDEQDLSRVNIDLRLFEAIVQGYMETIGEALHPVERQYFGVSAKWLAVTLGARFLMDYLNGDHYFRIHRPGHNLDRCRTQLKMAECIERHEKEIEKIVQRYS